jgi:tetratricopeptide (TPR) repeat protein
LVGSDGKDSSVEWVGSHSAITLSQVLRRIACEEKSGDLQVTFGQNTKTVFLKQGSVVFAASNLLDDRLGEAMLEKGSISEREYLLASNLMRTEGRKFGEALVRMGLLTHKELERHLCFQFNRIVLSLFHVHEGIYSFEERPPSIPDELMVTLSVPYLLLDGLRGVSDDKLLLSSLPSPKSRLRSTTRGFTNFDVSELRPEELTVLRAARNGATLESIVNDVGGELGRVLRLCGALYVLGFLQPEYDIGNESELQRKITTAYGQTERMNEHQLLEVCSGADRDAIERAYVMKRLDWIHTKRLVKEDPELQQMISEIQFRLAAAYHRLIVEKQPNPEMKSASNQGRSTKPVTTSGLTPITDLEKGLPSETVHGKEQQKLDKKAKEILQNVKEHVCARNWEEAIPLLFDLVELEPQNASYRGFLAKTMFKSQAMRKNAEGHFLEAIRLAPKDADLHLWLGLYYRSYGQGAQAAVQFRTALELDPRNRAAKRYLYPRKNGKRNLPLSF